jgi:hypothetical protein
MAMRIYGECDQTTKMRNSRKLYLHLVWIEIEIGPDNIRRVNLNVPITYSKDKSDEKAS